MPDDSTHEDGDTPADIVREPLTASGGINFTIIEALFFAYRDFTSDPDAILAQIGFVRAHHRVLHFVNRRPGLTVAELLPDRLRERTPVRVQPPGEQRCEQRHRLGLQRERGVGPRGAVAIEQSDPPLIVRVPLQLREHGPPVVERAAVRRGLLHLGDGLHLGLLHLGNGLRDGLHDGLRDGL